MTIAYRIGRKAGFDGLPIEACPYKAEEFVLVWVRGRRNAIASLARRRRLYSENPILKQMLDTSVARRV